MTDYVYRFKGRTDGQYYHYISAGREDEFERQALIGEWEPIPEPRESRDFIVLTRAPHYLTLAEAEMQAGQLAAGIDDNPYGVFRLILVEDNT